MQLMLLYSFGKPDKTLFELQALLIDIFSFPSKRQAYEYEVSPGPTNLQYSLSVPSLITHIWDFQHVRDWRDLIICYYHDLTAFWAPHSHAKRSVHVQVAPGGIFRVLSERFFNLPRFEPFQKDTNPKS